MNLHYLKRPNATLSHICISALHLTCIYPSTDWCLSNDSLTCQTSIFWWDFLKVYAKIKIMDIYIKPINIKLGQSNESQFQAPLWDTIWSSSYVTVLSPQLLSGRLHFHHVTNALEFLSCYSHTSMHHTSPTNASTSVEDGFGWEFPRDSIWTTICRA